VIFYLFADRQPFTVSDANDVLVNIMYTYGENVTSLYSLNCPCLLTGKWRMKKQKTKMNLWLAANTRRTLLSCRPQQLSPLPPPPTSDSPCRSGRCGGLLTASCACCRCVSVKKKINEKNGSLAVVVAHL
jgi:hypothetical protein